MTKITIKIVIDLVAMDFMINLCNFLLFISRPRQQQKSQLENMHITTK